MGRNEFFHHMNLDGVMLHRFLVPFMGSRALWKGYWAICCAKGCLVYAFLFCFLFVVAKPIAYGDPYENDLVLWAPVTLEVPVHQRARIQLTQENRWNDNLSHYATSLMREQIIFTLSPHMELAVGHQWNADFKEEGTFHDHRVLEALMVNHQLPGMERVSMQHRLQMEQRFYTTANQDTHRMRLRNQIRTPLGKTPFYGLLSNELFLNLDHPQTGAVQGFDQYRVIGAIGRPLGHWATWELGYMLRLTNNALPQANKLSHTLYSNVLLTPLKKSPRSASPPHE